MSKSLKVLLFPFLALHISYNILKAWIEIVHSETAAAVVCERVCVCECEVGS